MFADALSATFLYLLKSLSLSLSLAFDPEK